MREDDWSLGEWAHPARTLQGQLLSYRARLAPYDQVHDGIAEPLRFGLANPPN